jgi:hypothetical protein
MTATISQVKQGINTRLATITGLRTFTEQPSQVNAPVGYPNLDSITYHRSMRSTDCEMVFTVTVVVSRADERTGVASVDAYTSPTGTRSVKAAIEGDRTLGGIVMDSMVESASGLINMPADDGDYLAVDFKVVVYA